MKKMAAVFLILFLFLSAASCATIHVNESSRLAQGAGSFSFSSPEVASGKPVTVYYYKPKNLGPKPGVVFVMHGMSRNADGYRDAWSGAAEKYGLVVLAPRMTKEQFPGYIVGNMCKMNGEKVPQKDWYFNLIEEMFDKVRRENNFGAKGYYLYGHSAGAQFVHRYMLFMPAPRMIMALPANAGWYTMPDFKVKFPYGLAGSGLTRGRLDQALGRKVCILLGDRDNKPNGRYLRKTPEAKAQGPHRFARGHAFYVMGKSVAQKDKVPFNWRVSIVKGVGHNNRRIAPQAAGIIHEDMIEN